MQLGETSVRVILVIVSTSPLLVVVNPVVAKLPVPEPLAVTEAVWSASAAIFAVEGVLSSRSSPTEYPCQPLSLLVEARTTNAN